MNLIFIDGVEYNATCVRRIYTTSFKDHEFTDDTFNMSFELFVNAVFDNDEMRELATCVKSYDLLIGDRLRYLFDGIASRVKNNDDGYCFITIETTGKIKEVKNEND